jgi:hypothetical protein
MSDEQKIDEVLERVELGRRAAVRKILLGPMIYAAPVLASFSMDSVGGVASNITHLYAILDIGTVGSIIHQVVSIDISDPNNISYVPFGTISGFADKYFVSATLDPVLGKIFFALSDSDSNTSVDNIYLYSVTFPDLLTLTPFCLSNTVHINLNPQVTYDIANGLFYYAINSDPQGYSYAVNTIDSSGNIIVTSINASNLQNSSNGLQIFNNHIYATYRPGNSFTVYYASISDNTTGSISSSITPQPPGQIWSIFDLNGVLWGTTQYDGSSPPSYSLYQLQCTTAGLPASSPFTSALVGNMATTFENNSIANMTLFALAAQTQNQVGRPIPTTNTWGLAGMVTMMGAAAAFMLRRMRGR